MNRKFQSMLKQPWTNRLLALFMCVSLLLSSVAARPLAQSYDEAPPTPTSTPVVDPATPEPASPTEEQATPTDAPVAPTEEQASPTAEPPVPTEEQATPTAEAPTPAPTETAVPQQPAGPAEPAQAVNPKVVAGVNFRQLVIKFKNGYASALTDKTLSAQSSPGLAPLLDLLKDSEVKPFFSSLKSAPANQAVAQAESVLSRYYVAQLPESTDFAGAQQILDSIKSLSFIDTAYMEPIYKAAATPTDDFSPQQTYLGSSVTNGIEASTYAWDLDGGLGLGIKVYDIERGWQIGHEDLPLSKSYLLNSANTSQQDWVDHGTAVMGVIGAINIPDPGTEIGVEGIASDAELWMVSSVQSADLTPRSLADAINQAVIDGDAGDIIVIPLEALGPVSEEVAACGDQDSSFEDIPVEYWQANFDAILAATEAGFIVVEAAGNGQMNLDDDRYNEKFDKDTRDSGAILVGAGTSDTREPVCSTNYGRRVDLQGWGEGVVTTGYGDLFDGDAVDPEPTRLYTAVFGGTSAATAMIAGATASFLGVARDRDYSLTSVEVRDALHDTGVAQESTSALVKRIGPLVNLKNAIEKKIPEKVTLLSPPNGTIINTLRPTLDWQSFFNAEEYEVQVFRGSTNGTVVIDATTSSSIYTVPNNLTSGTLYYWRVRPMVDGIWLDWSVKWWFQPNGVSVPTTTLVSPADGSVFNHPADNPTFTWKVPSSAVDGYQIQISTISDFSTSLGSFDVDTNSYDGTTLDPNTRYYWRVRCRRGLAPPDPSANFSAWTSARVLYTSLLPIDPLLLPADGDSVDSLRPLFTWTGVTSARAYFLQIAKNSTFSSTSIVSTATISLPSGETVVPTSYLKSSDLPRNATLYWRVRDLGKYGWSAYSDYYVPAFSFTTGSPPKTPSQILPASGAVKTHPDDVVMSWSNPTGAAQFWLQISIESDFDTTVVDDNNASNPYDASLDPNGKYYWRVRAGDGTPIWSNWSGVRTFYTTPPDPDGLVTPTSPTDSLTPIFDWTIIPEASSYRLQVLKYSETAGTCTTTVVMEKTIYTNPPYTLSSALPRNANLCWRVRAGGLFGYSEYTTDDSEFQTPDPPYAPDLLSPASGSSLGTFAPLLDWASSPNQSSTAPSRKADEYQVQVSTSSGFTTTVIDTTVPLLTKLQLGPNDLADAGTYYWHVRAHNLAENLYSAWSSRWSFTTPPQFTGTIFDAMTVNPGPGDPVPAVNLQISGTSWTTTTDVNGEFVFRGLPPGTYDLLISKGNYMRQLRKISISRGNNMVQDFDIVPIPTETGMIRIQLIWGSSVADMDANLWLPKINKCLVNKDNLDGSVCPSPSGPANAEMIGNDTQAYGTEVITIDGTSSGGFYAATDSDPYVFAVYMNAESSKMGGSVARVTVYDGADNKGTFNVPSDANGIWWKVFTMKVGLTSRTITSVNSISTRSPAPY